MLTPFLTDYCKFEKDDISWVIIDGLHADNMKDKVINPAASWYNGKTLFDQLDATPSIIRS